MTMVMIVDKFLLLIYSAQEFDVGLIVHLPVSVLNEKQFSLMIPKLRDRIRFRGLNSTFS